MPTLWSFFFFFKNGIFLKIIYFWLCWALTAAHGLSLVAVSGGYSLLQYTGFSLWWLLLLWSTGSRHMGFSSCGLSHCSLQVLDCWLSSCGTQAQLLHSMWNLPRPGIKPVSPAQASEFLTTRPPGNLFSFIIIIFCHKWNLNFISSFFYNY